MKTFSLNYLDCIAKLLTFASAFENERCYNSVSDEKSRRKKEFFETLHTDRKTVQESCLEAFRCLEVKVRKEKEP